MKQRKRPKEFSESRDFLGTENLQENILKLEISNQIFSQK